MIGSRHVHQRRPAVNHTPRAAGTAVDILLLHYTGMADAQAALNRLCGEEAAVSCHYFVDEDGTIVQMVSEDRRAWHAGRAFWGGVRDINSHSVGVEIHNPGHEGGCPAFPPAQLRAVARLSRDIGRRYSLEPARVLAHSDVAPGRKRDPGEIFDWRYLSEAGVGLWVEPAPIKPRDGRLRHGDDGFAVEALQAMLASYGYDAPVTGDFDAHLEAVVAAFQRHFRPALVDGQADHSTLTTLDRLIRRHREPVAS